MIFYGSNLDPCGFKIKTVSFERLIKSSNSLFFYPFLAMRDKILSSDYGVTEKVEIGRHIYISACSMSEENST